MDLPRIPSAWREPLADALTAESTREVAAFLRRRIKDGATIYPPLPKVFAALEAVAPQDVRVVALAQDPYHSAGQAMGLALSVPRDVPTPSSLQNMQKELFDDLGIRNAHGDLTRWAKEGVLLLNTLLTVEEGTPLAHRNKGWEPLTDAIIGAASRLAGPAVFLLMGAKAQKKAHLVDETRHLVIRTAHPSGLSAHRGFFGSRPYSRINAFLRERGRGEIDWNTGA